MILWTLNVDPEHTHICLLIYICTWVKKVSLSKMAGRVTSAFYYYALLFHLILLTSSNNGLRFGDKAKTLHIVDDDDSFGYKQPFVINRDEHLHDTSETSSSRMRRDVPQAFPNNNPNITTKVRNCRFLYHKRSSSFDPVPLVAMPFIHLPHNLRCFCCLIFMDLLFRL